MDPLDTGRPGSHRGGGSVGGHIVEKRGGWHKEQAAGARSFVAVPWGISSGRFSRCGFIRS